MNTLKIVNCSAGYHGNSAIFMNINQEFVGGMYIVNGSNGSGKSTLFRTMAGVLKPMTGSVSFNGRNVHSDPDARAHISYLPHRLGGQASLKASTYLRFWTDIRSNSREAETRQQLASVFGLSELADRKLSTLSRGQMQRIALIKSLSSPASLFLLDEPYSGLDTQYTDVLTTELLKFRDNGAIVILSLHGPHSMRTNAHTEIDIAALNENSAPTPLQST